MTPPATFTQQTIDYYNDNAGSFWHGTKDHDVSQNIEALVRHIEGEAPFRILDFGCGPGRDLMDWSARGHSPVGLDGSKVFCEMARERAGVEVWHQDFCALDLPKHNFDGVFANATLFHVPTSTLPKTLKALNNTLKPGGVLMSSNPRGPDIENFSGDRFGAYHSLERWRDFMSAAGFEEIEHYYRPTGLPQSQQPWLVSLWRVLAVLVFSLMGTPAYADGPFSEAVQIQMKDKTAQAQLNAALSGPAYWATASNSTDSDALYDEIRLRPIGNGYMAMITGEGQQDYPHKTVASSLFRHLDQLPRHIEGAKRVVNLGAGIDPRFGVPYQDTFYFLDLNVFYTTYVQRMYEINNDDRTILYFEKLDESFVDADTWTSYQAKIKTVSDEVKLRWAPLNSVVPLEVVYGLYIVSPGQTHTTRVTFVSKIGFAEDAGWLINFASELPAVIKSGLKSGFKGCVNVAAERAGG